MPSMGEKKTKFNFVECLFSKRGIGVFLIFSLSQPVVTSTWALWAHQAHLVGAARDLGAHCLQLVCTWVQRAWKSSVTTHNREIKLWHSSCQFWGPVQNCHSDSAGDGSSDGFRHSDLHGPHARGQFSKRQPHWLPTAICHFIARATLTFSRRWWCETRMSVSHASHHCHLGHPLKVRTSSWHNRKGDTIAGPTSWAQNKKQFWQVPISSKNKLIRLFRCAFLCCSDYCFE